MTNGLSLDSVLAELHKTASVETPKAPAAKPEPAVTETPKVASAKADLVAALKRVEDAAAEKTAAAAETKPTQGPVAALEKTAADLAAADQEALVKEAHVYGGAICDGFMSRLKQYESAVADMPAEKQASAPVDVEKIASEAVRGYIETQTQIKVAAEQEYQRGYTETVAQIEKVASATFEQGAADAEAVIRQLAEQK